MKKIIDNKGTFQVLVPATWKYWVMEKDIHSFEENDSGIDSDCLQLSINPVTEFERNELADLLGYLPHTLMGDFDCRSHNDAVDDEGYVTKSWSTIYGTDHIYFTYTYSTNPEDGFREASLSTKLEIVYSVIASVYLIQDTERDKMLTSYRFEMFLQGIGATDLLLRRAIENKAFFEATCLFGNQIDSLLRIGIVLKKQILNKNDIIEREWIYQGVDDKKKSEKDIYKTSLAFEIITDAVYKSLFELYEDRNRVIHRFIISEITLAEVEQIAYQYYFLREEIKVITDDIETEQLRLNVGMTITDKEGEGNKSSHLKDILAKIGTLSYFLAQNKA